VEPVRPVRQVQVQVQVPVPVPMPVPVQRTQAADQV
jgi:hypothetical protein